MCIKLYSLLNVLDPRMSQVVVQAKNFLLAPIAALFLVYPTLKMVQAPTVITTVSSVGYSQGLTSNYCP